MSLSSTVFLLNLIGVLLFQGRSTKGGVVLSPSAVSACPEGLIALRCMLSTGSVATWTISVPNNTIRTVSILQSEQATAVQELRVGSNMISVERTSSGPFEVRLSANGSSSFSGSLISCSDGINTETATISITGRPIPLQGLTQLEQFNDGNVTVVFEWNASVSTTYSVKVEPSVLSVVMTGNTSVELTVPYNSPHSVTIVALNCAGQTNTTIEILYVNCGYPAVGENVVVGGYSFPAQNGSVVSFRCDDHSILAEHVLFTTSRCDNSGNWSPEPAGFRCAVDCGAPIPASMVTVEPYVNTTRGSLITYHCDDGLIPNNTFTATCQNDGQWSRDPSRHVCRLPTAAVCEDPAPPSHGSIAVYTSTVEGTNITFMCDEGYSPTREMTTTCTASGQWEPGPQNTECVVMDGKVSNPLTYGAAITLTAVVCSTVVFVIGCVVGVLCLHCILKYKKASTTDHESEQHEPVPVYEDVHTTSCDKQTIELNENVAYAQTKVR